jgi:hypothetical protein
LASFVEVNPVLELVAQVGQAEQRFAARVFQTGHPRKGDLEGNGDLTFDLLGRGAGILGHDFDNGGCGVGIGLDVDVDKGIAAARPQAQSQHDYDERVMDRPRDQLTHHVESLFGPKMAKGRRSSRRKSNDLTGLY